MSEEKPIKTLSSQIDWNCPWYRIRRDEIALPDGQEGVYNVIELPDSVLIVPVTTAGEIVLIRNYRYTLQSWAWEVPGGGILSGQTPQEAAEMELLEEIGGTTSHWQFLLKAASMNGMTGHHTHFFLARDVILGKTQHEATEFISIHKMPAKEAFAIARSGEMDDSLSICALLLAEAYLI